jgi:prepilin-type N-terminal cleavage/methylation domain-containing protein
MKNTTRFSAFTLIELLTVIAVIGILAAIIIPTVGAVRTTAKKTQTRAQFSQIINAYKLFKQEYGYFPNFDVTGPIDGGLYVFKDNEDANMFSYAFTGKLLDPSDTIPSAYGKIGNRKSRKTFDLPPDYLTSINPDDAKLQDAFNNTEIAIIYDYNNDGRITLGSGAANDATDTLTDRQVAAADGGEKFAPTTGSATATTPPDIPDVVGVRADVIIYSAGKDGSDKQAVMSWK